MVIFLSRKIFKILFLLPVAVITGFFFGNRFQLADTGAYKIRESFPPLVFLPDYQAGPKVFAGAAVLIEAKSGAVLYAKNPEIRRAPASTTKMMTAIVALEKGKLNRIIQVSRRAAATGGSTIRLRPGDRLSLRELLEGMMLCSGNDGSMAVAEGVAGSVIKFVELMNLKTKEIGALSTNFRNPHGLRAPTHYTTALDLALIARYGLNDPRFAQLVKQKTGVLEWSGSGKKVAIKNTNRLLWYLEGADGIKTGTTSEAGHCLVASATRDGKRLIAVALNSEDRWGDCARLLEYGFREFGIITVARAVRPFCRIKVKGGKISSVDLYPRRDLIAVVKNGGEELLKPRIYLKKQPVKAPLFPGQICGKAGYEYHGEIVEGVDLVVRRPVRRGWRLW